MKKILFSLVMLMIIIIGLAIALPIIYKEDIKKAIEQEITNYINAEVYYDVDKMDVSIIKNFPHLTVELNDFGVVGIDRFLGDTLLDIRTFSLTVDLYSVIFDDQVKLNKIYLKQPDIFIKVLKDGTANYDIIKASSSESSADPEESSDPVNIAIKGWEIEKAKVVYTDEELQLYTQLEGINHQGSGDFSQDVFDLVSSTSLDNFSLIFENEEYVGNKTLAADITLKMDLANMVFTFAENSIALNDFVVEANGDIKMPQDDIEFDLSFLGKDISIKSILSLIPGSYQEYLDGISSSGVVNFNGTVKGIFNDNDMPAVLANLNIDKGTLTYNAYNVEVDKIGMDATFSYPSPHMRDASLNVSNFTMSIDEQSLNASLELNDFDDLQWDLAVNGLVDLKKMSKIVPVEQTEIQGNLKINLQSKGMLSYIENEQYKRLTTAGNIVVSDFSYSESELLAFPFLINTADLKFDPKQITLDKFDSKYGSSDFNMTGSVSNYMNYILSENAILKGDFQLASSLIDINEMMPEEAEEEMSEQDENMSEDEALEIVHIPTNLDFVFSSDINKVAYDNMDIDNFKGSLLVKDGKLVLNKNQFNVLGGKFEVEGAYITQVSELPKYDLTFKVVEMSIGKAFSAFETIQKYVPIAKLMDGNFSTDFNVNGSLQEDMMPNLKDINLTGLFNIAKAQLQKGDFLNKLSAVANLKSKLGGKAISDKKISLKDVLVKTEIKDGRLLVNPFDLDINGQQAVMSGSNGLDGSLDYKILIKDISTGQLGSTINNALSSLTGGKNLIDEKINLNVGVLGNYAKPVIKLLGSTKSEGGKKNDSSVKTLLKSQIDEQKATLEAEIAKKKQEAANAAKAAMDQQKKKVETEAKRLLDQQKKKLEEEKKKAEEQIKNKLKGLFKKG